MAQMAMAGGMGLGLYSAAAQYSSTKSAGNIQRMESEAEAEMEELGATQREADRKARLAEALASQVAGAGAAGISAFEGSPLTILNADIEAEQKATQRGKFSTDLRAATIRMRGRTAQKMAKQQAQLGLLGSLGKMGMQGGMMMRGGGGGGGGRSPDVSGMVGQPISAYGVKY
jgi:hypothetical protein